MHTNNLFNDRTNTQLVDRLIGRSYEVVKAVYLNLPMLKELHESEAITFIFENFDVVRDLNAQVDNIKTVADNIDAILAVPEWVEKVEAVGNEKIDAINAISKASLSQITDLTKSSTSQITNLSNSYITTIKQTYEQGIRKIESLTEDSVDFIRDLTDTSAGSIENLRDESKQKIEQTVAEELNKALEDIKDEASNAMYSYRYMEVSDSIPYSDINISTVVPQNNLKPGDHVMDPDGKIYEVTSVSGSVFQVSREITSLKGEKGDTGLPGTGLVLKGVYETLEEFEQAGLIGEPGDAYQIYDPENPTYQTVMIWDTNTGSWKNGGAIQGARGESANEILMDPDPEKHFLLIYGQSSGDIIGSLNISWEGATFDPDPKETFENTIK